MRYIASRLHPRTAFDRSIIVIAVITLVSAVIASILQLRPYSPLYSYAYATPRPSNNSTMWNEFEWVYASPQLSSFEQRRLEEKCRSGGAVYYNIMLCGVNAIQKDKVNDVISAFKSDIDSDIRRQYMRNILSVASTFAISCIIFIVIVGLMFIVRWIITSRWTGPNAPRP